MDEDSFLAAAKNDVRLSGQFFCMKAVSQTLRMKQSANDQLRAGIFRSHGTHDPRTLVSASSVRVSLLDPYQI